MNIELAQIDADKIKKNITINHAKNAWIYILLLIPSYFLISVYFSQFKLWILNYYAIFVCIGLMAWRRVIFDTALNILRELPTNYISTQTSSWEDKISYGLERKIGYYWYHLIFLFISIGILFVKF